LTTRTAVAASEKPSLALQKPRLARAGCRLLFLTSGNRRSDAHTFYRRVGFEQTGTRFAKWLD
jgi:hypothetical protein